MATMKYVGARYMPKFMGTYDATTAYEALSVVDNGSGTTYVANKPVPVGTPLSDTDYWAVYGASSGAILDLQSRMGTAEGNITSLNENVDTIFDRIDVLLNVKYPPEGSGLTPLNGDGIDETSNLQAILDYALANDMGIFFPEGVYAFSSVSITFTSSHKTVNLFGIGNKSQLLSSGNGLIMINNSETSVPNYCRIEGLYFRGTSADDSLLLSLINLFNFKVSDCLFENAYNGLTLISNIWGNVSNCRINAIKNNGFNMIGNADDARALYAGNNAVNFYGCVAQLCRNGFYSKGSSGCNFYGCTSEGNSVCGIQIIDSGSFNGRGCLVSGGWFEFNPSGHIYLDERNGAADVQDMIIACSFIGDSAQSTNNCIMSIGENASILVEGCSFKRINGATWEPITYSPNTRCVHNKCNFVPNFANLTIMEYVDFPWAKILSNGTHFYRSKSVTNNSKTSTGVYVINIDHVVQGIFIQCLSDCVGYPVSLVTNADNTMTITINIKSNSADALTDSDFIFFAM